MIMQRFIPCSQLLRTLLDECFYKEENPYRNYQYELDSSIVDDTIYSSENTLISFTDTLSELSKDIEVIKHINSLRSEDLFLLYVAFKVTFIYGNATIQVFPLFPLEKLNFHLFAYVQTTYISFKKHCLSNNLSLWNEILDYEYDLYKKSSN